MYLHDKQSSEYLLKLLASHLVLDKVQCSSYGAIIVPYAF